MKPLRWLVVIALVVGLIPAGQGSVAEAAITDVFDTRFEESVVYLHELGVVRGRPDGFFPNQPIQRAEAVRIIIGILNINVTAQLLHGAYSFPDVPRDHWASGDIALAHELGIIGGFPDGHFRPAEHVTYAEFVKMLVEAAGLSPDPALSWPHNYTEVAGNQQMFIELPSFTPGTPAVRGDAAILATKTVRDVRNPGTGKTLAQSAFGRREPVRLDLEASDTATKVNRPVALTAKAYDEDGEEITGLPVDFETNSDGARVDAQGNFTASSPGSHRVTAESSGLSDTITIVVYGSPAELRVSDESISLRGNGTATSKITVEIVDSEGNRVRDAIDQISIAYDEEQGAVTLPETTSVKASAGTASFTVTATTNEGATDTLVFSCSRLPKLKVTVTAIGQTAAAVRVVATPTELSANVATSGLVTATIVDSDGRPMASGEYNVTFSVSGSGTLEGGTTTQTVRTIGQRASLAFTSLSGKSGTIRIKARASGLSEGSATVSARIGSQAARIKVLPASVSGEAGEAGAMRVAVSLADSRGQPTVAAEDVTVTFKAPAGSGLMGLEPLTFSAAADDSVHVIDVWGTKAGEYKITVSEAGTDLPSLDAADFDCEVKPGPVDHLAITPDGSPTVYIPTHNPRLPLTAQLRDMYGNDVAQGGVKLKFTATGGAHTWSPPEGVVTTGSDGRALATLVSEASPGASYTVNVGADLDGDESYAGAVGQTETGGIILGERVPFSISRPVVRNPAGDVISRMPANASEIGIVTVVVKDDRGEAVPAGHAVEIRFGDGGIGVLSGSVSDVGNNNSMDASGASDGIYTFATDDAGEVDFSFKGGRAGGFAIVARSLNTGFSLSRSLSFQVDPGLPVGCRIYRDDWSLADGVSVVGGTPRRFRLTPVDNGGNRVAAAGAMTVDLTPDRANGWYHVTVGDPPQTRFDLRAGTGLLTLYYSDDEDVDGLNLSDDAKDMTAYQLAVGWDAGLAAIVAEVTDVAGEPLREVRVMLERIAGDGSFDGGGDTIAVTTGANGRAVVAYADGGVSGGEEIRATLIDARNVAGGGEVEPTATTGDFAP